MTKTISVTWDESTGEGRLHAVCHEDHTLASNTVRWSEPITASTDAWSVAHAVTEINGARIVAVDHDSEHVHVTVEG